MQVLTRSIARSMARRVPSGLRPPFTDQGENNNCLVEATRKVGFPPRAALHEAGPDEHGRGGNHSGPTAVFDLSRSEPTRCVASGCFLSQRPRPPP